MPMVILTGLDVNANVGFDFEIAGVWLWMWWIHLLRKARLGDYVYYLSKAISQHLNQYWLRSPNAYGVTMSQWINRVIMCPYQLSLTGYKNTKYNLMIWYQRKVHWGEILYIPRLRWWVTYRWSDKKCHCLNIFAMHAYYPKMYPILLKFNCSTNVIKDASLLGSRPIQVLLCK